MVKGRVLRTPLQEALRELVLQSHMHPKVVYPNQVADFMSWCLTGEWHHAKMLWKNTLRARVFSTCMDMLLIQEIDEYLYKV